MTTTFHLVRHAAHDRVGTVLCGRMPGVHLGAFGREQAERLARRFANENIGSVQTSPLERARETAEPIAGQVGKPAEVNEGIIEIEFGAWTGKPFEALNGEALWSAWNTARSVNRPPGGETMLEAQARIVAAMEVLRASHRDTSAVLVSHGDVIKAALLYYLGLPIDAYTRMEVEPASISTVVVGDWGAKIVRINEVVAA